MMKTQPFDPLRHIKDPLDALYYLVAALDDYNPQHVADALETIARSEAVSHHEAVSFLHETAEGLRGPRPAPLTAEQYLMVSLMEECAEVTQRAAKALRFGLGEVQPGQDLDNAERIDQEFTDVLTVHDELVNRNVLTPQAPCELKRQRIDKYMDFARDCGTLVPGKANKNG